MQLENGLQPKETGKAYKEKGLAKRAASGRAWRKLYKAHVKNGTVPNEEAFSFLQVCAVPGTSHHSSWQQQLFESHMAVLAIHAVSCQA